MTEAIRDIAAERKRQIDAEGWTPEHDDEHGDGSLALAAALYATPTPLFEVRKAETGVRWRDPWPWHTTHVYARYGDDPIYTLPDGDKRVKHGRRRRLVIAAALLVAEIERLDRAQEQNP